MCTFQNVLEILGVYIENIASGIVERMQRLGVDGVDFMQAEGCGIRNMRCDDQTSTQLYLLELIRKKMPKGINIFCVFIYPFVQFIAL